MELHLDNLCFASDHLFEGSLTPLNSYDQSTIVIYDSGVGMTGKLPRVRILQP